MAIEFTKSKLLVILGSTSTGKTDLAFQLASKFHGELVSADSRQVYIGLDIGTGKLPSGRWKVEDGRWKKGKGFWWLDGVKIWMYDVEEPRKQYTVYNYVKDASKVIGEIRERGKLPIVVGGTGLYLKALLEGLPNLAVPIDKNLRKKLKGLSKEELQEKLQKIAHNKWESLNYSDRENPRRLIRAIELSILSSRGALSEVKGRRGDLPSPLKIATLIARNDVFKIGLTAPRQTLYQRIDEWVVKRINQGMIEEAKKLHENGLSFKRMRQLGLEYGVLADYLESKIASSKELIKIMQGRIHGYARRQLTWFKKEKNVYWFDITDEDFIVKVENLIAKWYDNSTTYATRN